MTALRQAPCAWKNEGNSLEDPGDV
jgi:hypothetical protein